MPASPTPIAVGDRVHVNANPMVCIVEEVDDDVDQVTVRWPSGACSHRPRCRRPHRTVVRRQQITLADDQ